MEVSFLDPSPTLALMPFPTPMPDHTKDPSIHLRKCAFAGRMTVVHGPAFDLLIQTLDQLACRHPSRLVNRFLDLGQERRDASPGRFQ
jgi:hypothetical protein